ncbi:MAG TPA: PAS domain S-box protein [Flavisolibacter sp.]|jgi:PAS domain S-box-containing protein|nr:PAS domain S-box protein [Flavisolibacter sp.]
MLTYTLPIQENERLTELYAYEILDTDKEDAFEELAMLASSITDCPIASITFVDKDRQWFKARTGDNTPETARSIAFCSETILQEDFMVIEDARLDQRFANNPDVTGGLGIVFYAGVPIYSVNGYKVGTICIIDHVPKKLLPGHLSSLKLISKQVSNLLELRLKNNMLKAYSRKLLNETENSYESFFSDSALPKWIYDLETLQILKVNQSAMQLYGYTREEFLKLSVFDIRDQEEKEHIQQLLQTLNSETNTISFETIHVLKDNTRLDVDVSIRNILYRGRKARLATMTDITEKVALRNKLNRQRHDQELRLDQIAKSVRAEVKDEIGKELHDNINQILASTKLYLEIASSNPDMREEMILLSKRNVSDAMEEIRILSKSLVLGGSEFDLVESLRNLVKTYELAKAFSIRMNLKGFLEDLPDDMKMTLFRIVQESLNNTSKHAEASEVIINCTLLSTIVLEIHDNGKGFLVEEKGMGIGLINIRNRVQFYDGKVDIQSSPGKGFAIRIEMPVDEL